MAAIETEYSGIEILPPKLRKQLGAIANDGHHGVARQRIQEPTSMQGAVDDGFTTSFNHALLKEPRRGDAVVGAAQRTLSAYNDIDFNHFANPIRLQAVDSSAFSAAWTTQGSALYAAVRNDRVALVELRISSHGRGNEVQITGGLQIKVDDLWTAFEAWVFSLPVVGARTVSGDAGYKVQWQWWQRNGHHFPLMNLLPEIVQYMLLRLLGEVVYCRSRFISSRQYQGLIDWGGEAFRTEYPSQAEARTHPKDVSPVNTAVIYLNRATSQAALDVLAKDIVKFFDNPIQLADLCWYTPIGRNMNNLRHIQLALSHEQYLRFFGVKVAPFGSRRDSSDAETLGKLPNIRSLELRFMPTLRESSNPWERRGDWDSEEPAWTRTVSLVKKAKWTG